MKSINYFEILSLTLSACCGKIKPSVAINKRWKKIVKPLKVEKCRGKLVVTKSSGTMSRIVPEFGYYLDTISTIFDNQLVFFDTLWFSRYWVPKFWVISGQLPIQPTGNFLKINFFAKFFILSYCIYFD